MPEREWRIYLDDMAKSAERVIIYSQGLSREAFESNSLKFDAITRSIELIFKAATHIPDEVRASNPNT